MAKKITDKKPFGVQSVFNDNTDGGLNIVEEVLDSAAFSIVYNGNKKYSVVKIPFASRSTNSAGPVEVVASNLDIYEAQHEFKKATVDAGLFEIRLDK